MVNVRLLNNILFSSPFLLRLYTLKLPYLYFILFVIPIDTGERNDRRER